MPETRGFCPVRPTEVVSALPFPKISQACPPNPGMSRPILPRVVPATLRLEAGKLLLIAIFLCGQGRAICQQEAIRVAAVRAVAPDYPPAALALPKGDDAIVEVTISANGDVTGARPVQGSRLLYAASLNAAKKWRFQTSSQRKQASSYIFISFAATGCLRPGRSGYIHAALSHRSHKEDAGAGSQLRRSAVGFFTASDPSGVQRADLLRKISMVHSNAVY